MQGSRDHRTRAARNVERKALAKLAMREYVVGLIQLAWRFLHIPEGKRARAMVSLSRTKGPSGARKTTMIVALARKILIAFWRLVTTGEVPEGVELRPSGMSETPNNK